ncbi:potassium channel family protein [Kocuria sp. NPDC057446]|uniref:potassium channel family protein n=1 Tax=Kocuria sp. NPDC057446 TaxID=3346137 RepID=UPI0036C3DBB4
MITVVVLWVLLQGVGWALVYLPHVPGGFTYSPGVDPADCPDPVEALYISFVTLATLGFGDVVATDPWIRLATPLEALTGFALLTAARVLDGLTAGVAGARIDFTQHGETYYFQEEDPDLSLARRLSYALELRDRAAASAAPRVRTGARRLGLALEQLAHQLRKSSGCAGQTPADVFAAYAEDHGRDPRR